VRVAILGNSGSRKSVLARRLAERYGAARLDFDTVAWEPGKIAVARDPVAAARDVESFCDANERWVLGGCSTSLVRAALRYRPHLLFLDPGVAVCQANCRADPAEVARLNALKETDPSALPAILRPTSESS